MSRGHKRKNDHRPLLRCTPRRDLSSCGSCACCCRRSAVGSGGCFPCTTPDTLGIAHLAAVWALDIRGAPRVATARVSYWLSAHWSLRRPRALAHHKFPYQAGECRVGTKTLCVQGRARTKLGPRRLSRGSISSFIFMLFVILFLHPCAYPYPCPYPDPSPDPSPGPTPHLHRDLHIVLSPHNKVRTRQGSLHGRAANPPLTRAPPPCLAKTRMDPAFTQTGNPFSWPKLFLTAADRIHNIADSETW